MARPAVTATYAANTPIEADIYIDPYCDFDETFTWIDPASATPVDLTGCSAQLQVKEFPWDDVPLVDVTTTPTAGSALTLGSTAGTIRLQIGNTASQALQTVVGARFDLIITWSDGTFSKFMFGFVKGKKTETT